MSRWIFARSSIAHHYRSLMARVAPFAAAGSAALILWHAARDNPAATADVPAPLVYPRVSAAMPPAATQSAALPSHRPVRAVQQASVASTIEVIVGRNDTMDAIFRRMAFDKADLAAMRNLPGIRQSLDFLRPGDAIRVTHSSGGSIAALSRKVSETETLEVVRGEGGFAATLVNDPVETRIRTATATIDSSLFQAAAAADMSDLVALKLADVFAWDIDFVLDIRQGDRFTAVYQQIYQNGKYLRDGAVLAAEFVNAGRTYRAVRFTAADGTAGYYTPQGTPLRKPFLRAPVEFTRVSSVFNPHRLHPILNLIRGHMGTDYAAPTGTPVHAAGDGRVNFEGTRGGYGNAIVLLHGNNVSTLYGHLSRFAGGVHFGSHVVQGQVIGYVGMSGLATGPHLHYEYLLNGVHLNPQTVRLPGAEMLQGRSLAEFHAAAAPWLAALSAPAAGDGAPHSSPATALNAGVNPAGAPASGPSLN